MRQVPKMEDFQFFNSTRVNALYDKEAAFLTFEFNRGAAAAAAAAASVDAEGNAVVPMEEVQRCGQQTSRIVTLGFGHGATENGPWTMNKSQTPAAYV
jgi:hypothetical protein